MLFQTELKRERLLYLLLVVFSRKNNAHENYVVLTTTFGHLYKKKKNV